MRINTGKEKTIKSYGFCRGRRTKGNRININFQEWETKWNDKLSCQLLS